MAIIEFFKINNTDLTPLMEYQAYNMNSAPVIREWTDGNMIDHRDTIRNRRSGGFRLEFKNEATYQNFLSLMETAKNVNGFYNVTAFIQNTNSTDTFSAFIDYTTEAKWDFANGREYRVATVTVKER